MGLIGSQGRVCEECRRESFLMFRLCNSLPQVDTLLSACVESTCAGGSLHVRSLTPIAHGNICSALRGWRHSPLPPSPAPSVLRSMSANLSLLSPPDCATTTAATLSPSAFSDKPISRSVQRQARDGGERVGTDCTSKMLRMGKQHVDVGRRRILRVRRDGCHRSDDARPWPVKSSSALWAE